MVEAKKRRIKSLTTYEKISSACLVLSLVANVYLGYSTHGLQKSNSEFERQIKQRETEPDLVQEYLVVPGNSFRALTRIDWSKATIQNAAHPEFVETPLGARVYRLIDAEHAERALKSIQVTFLTIRNDGKSSARGVRLITEQRSQDVLLGDIGPGTTKLIPTNFFRSQPLSEESEPRQFTKYVYTVAGVNGPVQREDEVRERSETSWIPVLDALRGVGRALVSGDHEHLFR